MRKIQAIALVLLIVDRALKTIVLAVGPIRLSPDLVLAPTINTHPIVPFALPASISIITVWLMPVTHIATLAVLVYALRKRGCITATLGWSLLAIGYVSNAADCWLYAGVVDPITVAVSGGWWFGFNVADLSIVTATFILASSFIKGDCLCRLLHTAAPIVSSSTTVSD